MMTNTSIVGAVVSEVLKHRLASLGFSGADIVIEKDFDGEDVIRVTAKLSKQGVDSEALFEAASDIRQRLIAEGDDRFVFVKQSAPQGSSDEADEDAEGLSAP